MESFAPKTILCPVDLSPATGPVLSWAARFAQRFSSKVEILHAVWSEPPRYFTPAQARALAAQARRQKVRLEREIGRWIREHLGPAAQAEIRIVEGHPIPVLLERLAQVAPDLTVMGSHGRSGVARMMLGSVAENVVREAARPTLIVKEGGGAPRTLERILCPVGFTEISLRTLELSAALAASFGAQLKVVHALETKAGDLQATREDLCRWVPEELRTRCVLKETVRRGNAAEQILLLARERAVGLIVLAAEHRPFLEFMTLGTTTERVLRHSSCSVLVVPEKPARISSRA